MQSSFSQTSRAGTTLAWFLAVAAVSGTAVAICRESHGAAGNHGSALAERRSAQIDVEAEAAARICSEPASRIRALAAACVAGLPPDRRDLETIAHIGFVRSALEDAGAGSERFVFERAHERFLELAREDAPVLAERALREEVIAALAGDDERGLIAER